MLSASPTMKSSLEEMLESLRQRDEALERSKVLPPALPARPMTRGRLPSARHSLPTDFMVGVGGAYGEVESKAENGVCKGKEQVKRKEELGLGASSFGSKKIRMDNNSADSNPYVEENSEQQIIPVLGSMAEANKDPEWNDNIGYFTKKSLSIWCRLCNGQWGAGKIQSTAGDTVTVLLSSGNVVQVSREELLPANPDILEGVDDLIQLSYLNEPSVLHNLKYRYFQNKIYSKAGPLLIAINPFKDMPIYEHETVAAYKQKVLDSPHVFAVVDAAYSEMMRDEKNQSIIISGESGAGKTETAKYAMQYLAALSGNGGMGNQILQIDCILEAFGNAKTFKNDNSTRFGKLIEIHFSTSGKICGATIQTLLLEKSRVVQLVNGDRSYHVFYQLCAGASSDIRDRLNLQMASEYRYLSQSDCLAIDGVDDCLRFSKLMEAFDAIQISKEDQEMAFSMVAAVLWLGNISFQLLDNENHVVVSADEAVETAARLISCSIEDLMQVLSTHKIQAGKDSIASKLTLQQAIDRRDALSKFIYGSLFEWLVELMNKSLKVGEVSGGKSISILDIYGFESFKNNSFDQFCINYANERLQQHFNRHVFKLEQEEYEEDGIDWTKVDFEDNQECLNLFEKKPLGLLSLLDEESNFAKATDLTFANKLKQQLKGYPCFKCGKGRAFSVNHYAGEILYDTNGFLEKNRDLLVPDLVQLLSSCGSQLPYFFASKILNQSPKLAAPLSGLDLSAQSVGSKFKGQLFKLMHQLESTTPHFICCIKPNTKLLPGMFEEDLISRQLHSSRVLEVVRISRSGFPIRLTHQDFARRYGFLLLEENVIQDPLSISVSVLKQFNVLPEMYQVGYTKVHLRNGQIVILEERRNQVVRGIVGFQKCFRGRQAHLSFHKLRKGVTILQSFVRGENTRRKYSYVETRCLARPSFAVEDKQTAVIYLQSVIRRWLAQKKFDEKHKAKQLNPESIHSKRKTGKKILEVKVIPQEQVDIQTSILAGLQKRVVKAEATIRQKKEENAALQEQLQHLEKRWLDYEAKMKATEELWKVQVQSLEASLASARKSLAAENPGGQSEKPDVSTSPRFYDAEDNMSPGSQTPGESTPNMFCHAFPNFMASRENNGPINTICNLTKEFENRRQNFEDDAKVLVEVCKALSATNANPGDEFRKLKLRFKTWKRDYKLRLQAMKAKLNKFGNGEEDKTRRKWWGKLSVKSLQH